MIDYTKRIIRHKHEIEIQYFPKPRKIPNEVGTRHFREIDADNLDSIILDSLKRTKHMIKDYARNNDFDWFVTLTLDPKKYNSFDIDVVYHVVRCFLQKLRRNTEGELKYILVPEYHKDKQKIHLHGYIKGNLAVKKTDEKYKNKRVYNIYDWTAGWSTAIRIGNSVNDTLRCSSYITKYVTKDMLVSFNKKRYWASRNLETSSIIKEEIEFHDSIEEIWPHHLPTEMPDVYKIYKNGSFISMTILDEKIEEN